MRCENSSRVLLLALCFSVLALASGYGQDQTRGQPLISVSSRLNDLATRLEQTLTASEADWEILSKEWTNLSLKLDELARLSKDSEREMQYIKESQRISELMLKQSIQRTDQLKSDAFWSGFVAVVAGGAAVGFGVAWALK
jgi:hypothetical protein